MANLDIRQTPMYRSNFAPLQKEGATAIVDYKSGAFTALTKRELVKYRQLEGVMYFGD
ncbi:MAG: hypothetical protein ACR652_13720 [Methylocystis sp.]|uniref:hypothetical protein n=1 Tax=Methylocystis sp. TaxID=1911079 RepID=UPI003DA1C967